MSDSKLEWMYKNSSVDPEEYLLGRAVDKNFEKQAYNDVDKDILPSSIFANSTSSIQVDVVRKIKEDPLEKIKQKEIELRKQLLKNPVKLKKLRNMLDSKSERKKSEKNHKKKKKASSDELDSILTEKYSKFVKKYGAKNLVELTKTGSDSSEGDLPTNSMKNKHRKKNNDSNSSSESSEDDHLDSTRSKRKSNTEYSKYKSSKDAVKTSGYSKDRKNKKRASSESSYSSQEESSSGVAASNYRNIRRPKYQYDSDDDKSISKKTYGLELPKGGKRDDDSKNRSTSFMTNRSRKFESTRSSDKYKRPAQTILSKEEKAKRLKEMMANAQWRDEDRKSRVTKYREEQRKEEGKEQKYDDEFLRNQMAKVSSKSVEERIKSKKNQLQRLQ